MNAKELMTPAPTFVHPDDLISHAAWVMNSKGFGVLPVLDETNGNRLVGIITDRDIVVRCTAENHVPGECLVRDHMTREDFATVSLKAKVKEIAATMEKGKVRRVLVVDAQNHVAGIIGQADLTRMVGQKKPELIEEVLETVLTPVGAGS